MSLGQVSAHRATAIAAVLEPLGVRFFVEGRVWESCFSTASTRLCTNAWLAARRFTLSFLLITGSVGSIERGRRARVVSAMHTRSE